MYYVIARSINLILYCGFQISWLNVKRVAGKNTISCVAVQRDGESFLSCLKCCNGQCSKESSYLWDVLFSEIEVLMAGVRWLYGNWPARRRLVVDIMRCIRFGLISPWQLVDIKRNPDNAEILEIVNEPEVQQMVDDGLAFVFAFWILVCRFVLFHISTK